MNEFRAIHLISSIIFYRWKVCVLVWCSSSNSGGNDMCVSTAQCVLEKHDTWFPSAALPNVTEPRDCLTFTFNSCLLKSAGMPVCVSERGRRQIHIFGVDSSHGWINLRQCLFTLGHITLLTSMTSARTWLADYHPVKVEPQQRQHTAHELNFSNFSIW